ncbi:hypothetical protein JKP88DRAFT_294451, partial [Tribonema minus]
EDDKFFAGDGISRGVLARDSASKGRCLDVKVTLPRRGGHGGHGAKRKLVTYGCKLSVNGGGAVLTGRAASTDETPFIQSADIAGQWESATGCRLNRLTVADSRASQLLLVPQPHAQRWWVVPARQPFTRHSGTCIVLGDRATLGPPQRIRVGDFLRLGSVGLLVTETHNGATHAALSEAQLQELAMDREGFPEELFDGEAITASSRFSQGSPSHQRRLGQRSVTDLMDSSFNYGGDGSTPAPASERDYGSDDDSDLESDIEERSAAAAAAATPLQCYMCFDDDEEGDNPLVAPCECRGSTKYVHVHCLQRWHTSKERHQPCIVSNKKGAQVCGVCKAPYKTHLRLPNGDFIPLLRPQLRPPFISFTVCTRHQHQEELFSTRFHLSFSSLMLSRGGGAAQASQRPLVIGRSQTSDMVLDYRTVSTHHAAVSFAAGGFHLQDLRSSNGSFLYVREPVQLRWGNTLRLRWGKGSIALRAPAPAQSYLLPRLSRRRAAAAAAANSASAPSDSGATAGGSASGADENALDDGAALDLLSQLAVALPGESGGDGG